MRLRGGVSGLDGLRAALGGIADGEVLDEALAATAEAIRDDAAARLTDGTPPESRSGALAESLTVHRDGDGGYVVGTPLEHGWHLEFGSSGRAPAPWLTPAAEEARPALAERAKESLDAAISDGLRRTR